MTQDDASGEALALEEGGLTAAEAVKLALAFIKEGHTKKADEVLSHVVEVIPDHADALNYLAILTCHIGDRGKALALAKRAAEAEPDHAGIHNNLGNILLANGDIPAAADAYHTAVRLDPAAPDIMCNLAVILRAQRRYDEAEDLLRRALWLNPEHGIAHKNLARVLTLTGRSKEAIDHSWKAVQYLGSDEHYVLARAYSRAGEKEKAVAVMKQWLASEPDNPHARFLFAAFTDDGPPARAPEDYVEEMFDRFAQSFDTKLASLDYLAPQLVAAALERRFGPPRGDLTMLDAGCGTGLCAPLVKGYCRHLSGVDLSRRMLDEAARLNLYDRLDKAELTAFIAAHPNSYDVIISADTLCYFGALEEFASRAFGALVGGGGLIFTVEALGESDGKDFRLMTTGRYSHAAGYLARVLDEAGFELVAMDQRTLRSEDLSPVLGHVVTARRRV